VGRCGGPFRRNANSAPDEPEHKAAGALEFVRAGTPAGDGGGESSVAEKFLWSAFICRTSQINPSMTWFCESIFARVLFILRLNSSNGSSLPPRRLSACFKSRPNSTGFSWSQMALACPNPSSNSSCWRRRRGGRFFVSAKADSPGIRVVRSMPVRKAIAAR